ncbi:hypothetical protein BDZ97DRAFT_1922093 [Flammula alnicola]|nr:hypothetical protein BDZ97DRAFT_1922093 [Flammula alnicola]
MQEYLVLNRLLKLEESQILPPPPLFSAGACVRWPKLELEFLSNSHSCPPEFPSTSPSTPPPNGITNSTYDPHPPNPQQVKHLRHQTTNILHALSSTFTICAPQSNIALKNISHHPSTDVAGGSGTAGAQSAPPGPPDGGGSGSATNSNSNSAQDRQEDEGRMSPKMCKAWMHRELEALSTGGGAEARLSPESASGSGSGGMGGHELDGIFGGPTSGRLGLGVRIEDGLSYRHGGQPQRERELELHASFGHALRNVVNVINDIHVTPNAVHHNEAQPTTVSTTSPPHALALANAYVTIASIFGPAPVGD